MNEESHDLYFWGIKKGVLLDRQDYSFHLASLNWSQRFDHCNNQIAELNLVASAREAQIAQLQHVITEKNEQVIQLEYKCSELVFERKAQIAQLQHVITEKNEQVIQIEHKCSEFVPVPEDLIVQLNSSIAEKNERALRFELALNEANSEIIKLTQTNSWKLTLPLREVRRWVTAPKRQMRRYVEMAASKNSCGINHLIDLTVSWKRKLKQLIMISPEVIKTSGGVWAASYKLVSLIYKQGPFGVKVRLQQIVASRNKSSATALEIDVRTKSEFYIVPHYIGPNPPPSLVTNKEHITIAIHLHLYEQDMLDEFIHYCNNMPFVYDLYVSVRQECNIKKIRRALNAKLVRLKKIYIESVPNRGRDLAPLVIQFGPRLCQYDVIGHFHTKKSIHNSSLGAWYKDCMDLLMGFPGSGAGTLKQIIELLCTKAKLIYSEPHSNTLQDPSGWAENYTLAEAFLIKHTKHTITDYPLIQFPYGSMFWSQTACLREFLSLPLTWSDFPEEPTPSDGTLAHVLARCILIFAREYDGLFYCLHKGDSIRDYQYYETQRDYSPLITHKDVRVLSYYLPQFHPTPENDLWHGKGFTEWTKVRQANPLFAGHYQQHIPHLDLGYYLIDCPDVLKRQAEMMRCAGVSGQIFYHYWFSGKLILDGPAKLLLSNPDIPMPFCFCWANENWTKCWDGNESEILLEQTYSSQDAIDFIQYIIPFFKDSRYIRIDNRPVLFIYRPSSISDHKQYLRVWSEECAKHGLNSPYIVAVLTRGAMHPDAFGMDAGVERVLHDWTNGAVPNIKETLIPYEQINGSILSYNETAEYYIKQTDVKTFTYFRSIVPTWDNTARYGSDAYALHGSTPALFQNWLEQIVTTTREHLPEDKRFVVINAWNEWAEGAHLEPDSRFGFGYLNSIGRALSGISYAKDINPSIQIPSQLKVHLFFSEYIKIALKQNAVLKQKFISNLIRSTVFDLCSVSHNLEEIKLLVNARFVQDYTSEAIDYLLEFRQPALMFPCCIEKMLFAAIHHSDSVVITNRYSSGIPLPIVGENSSVSATDGFYAPVALIPSSITKLGLGYRNFKMCTDAWCFVLLTDSLNDNLPIVSTIIRFHGLSVFSELRKALYCLFAMDNCLVRPVLATQDLDQEQILELETMLDEFDWPEKCLPQFLHYKSIDGKRDLRSKLLNEALRATTTRYVTFLDYDDLIMPHAYRWLLQRLITTGKAIAFGRVYATFCETSTHHLLRREPDFQYGYTYDDFLDRNHAPLHSFMLDTEQLIVTDATYYDDQKYMEDYYLMLQLVQQDNADWEGLGMNVYIGDYIHHLGRSHTLARVTIEDVYNNAEYLTCQMRVESLQSRSRKRRIHNIIAGHQSPLESKIF